MLSPSRIRPRLPPEYRVRYTMVYPVLGSNPCGHNNCEFVPPESTGNEPAPLPELSRTATSTVCMGALAHPTLENPPLAINQNKESLQKCTKNTEYLHTQGVVVTPLSSAHTLSNFSSLPTHRQQSSRPSVFTVLLPVVCVRRYPRLFQLGGGGHSISKNPGPCFVFRCAI